MPKIGDTIICKVIDVGFNGWRIDTNSAYSAMLSMKDATSDFIARGANLTQYYDLWGAYCLQDCKCHKPEAYRRYNENSWIEKIEGRKDN